MEYTITNIKVSVKSKAICLDTVLKLLSESCVNYKQYMNYIVIQSTYTYVMFKPNILNQSNHVNITKISKFGEIDKAKKYLGDLLKIEISEAHIVDNITVSTTLLHKCIPDYIISLFKGLCKITFNQETFPGVFLKFSVGTAIVFHTGKCILIGCKSIDDIETILTIVKKTLDQNELL